jgi:hypothetical protein
MFQCVDFVASTYCSRGIPECIFTTQPRDDPSKLIIGATVANYPAKSVIITRTKFQIANKLAQPSKRSSAAEGIKGLFKEERFRRIDMVQQTSEELMERFRLSDQEYLQPLALLDTEVASGGKDEKRNVFLSRATVNFYIGQRSRTTKDWKQFDHRNQVAMSFFVVCRHLMQIIQPTANARNIEFGG